MSTAQQTGTNPPEWTVSIDGHGEQSNQAVFTGPRAQPNAEAYAGLRAVAEQIVSELLAKNAQKG